MRTTHFSNPFKRLLPPALMMIVGVACSETTMPFEPLADEPVGQVGRQLVRFNDAMVPDRFATVEVTDDGEIPLNSVRRPQVMFDGGQGLTLSHYEVSFWVKKGKKRQVEIEYLDTSKNKPKWQKYFRIKFDKKSLLAMPDGTPIHKGDSVLITAVVDPEYMAVSLEPSGIQFAEEHPVEITWYYKGAAEDVNGDGVVDEIDEFILNNLVMLWQHGKGDPWFDMSFEHDRGGKKIIALLRHFSSYAVSW